MDKDYNSFLEEITKTIDKGLHPDIAIKDPNFLYSFHDKLSVRFDVFATLRTGEKIVIEMQANHMKGDNIANNHMQLFNRAVLYITNLYATPVENVRGSKSCKYDSLTLPNVYNLWFGDFTVFANCQEYWNTAQLYFPHPNRCLEHLNIGIVELSKLAPLTSKDYSELTEVDKASLFIKYLNSSKYSSIISDIIKHNEVLRMVSDNLNTFAREEESLYTKFYALRKRISDMNLQALANDDVKQAAAVAEVNEKLRQAVAAAEENEKLINNYAERIAILEAENAALKSKEKS
ncbi:MAG: Rpn family recombination-promoting nuclease/putative transposase [Deltaproteobacteria bacterium]|nr:Rpn family recombination-promoting nuclease/putative transposase [Deltaproteobacteria bacterium]